jgi:hypothetical protein
VSRAATARYMFECCNSLLPAAAVAFHPTRPDWLFLASMPFLHLGHPVHESVMTSRLGFNGQLRNKSHNN